MPAPQNVDFIGFGRVIERHKSQDVSVLHSTLPSTPSSQSTSSTSFPSTRNIVLPEEASIVCQNVLAELALLAPGKMLPTRSTLVCKSVLGELDCGMVEVLVATCKRGCICGHLCWGSLEPQAVVFVLQETRPGYTLVESVQAGPPHFRNHSWVLKFVNACRGISPMSVGEGDTLVLEIVSCNRGLLEPSVPEAPPLPDDHDSDDFYSYETELVCRAMQQPPAVPKLDLSDIDKSRHIFMPQSVGTPAACVCKALWGCF